MKGVFMIYGYIRVSTDKQTTENQRFEIENYCVKNGIKIDEWINETISGKEPFEKRKLGKLLKTVRRNDVLICSELSRLSRTMYSMILALEKCEKNGIEIIAIKESFNPKKDRMSKYIVPIFAVLSEVERDLISQRTKEALARLKTEGVKLGRPIGSKSKSKKLSGKEKEINKMLSENISLRKMSRKLKINIKTLRSFIAENKISIK
jgi:DNA invertase Pin-like site-specific DNA recombinase